MKTPRENIDEYYNRAKKIKSAIVYAKNDLPRQENLLSYLNQLEDFVNRSNSISDLEEIREEMVDNKLIKKKGRNKKNPNLLDPSTIRLKMALIYM